MKPVNVGLLGLGTVGAGTVNVLRRNAEEIERRAGRGIHVTMAAARDLPRQRACETRDIRLTDDPFAVVNDPAVDVVVELIGGDEIARELVLAAIRAGKPVVTANKALLALHGQEIFDAAHEHGVAVAFEGAVAGGIPIIKAIREGLAGNRIEWLAGIINGTGNYILTQMRDRGLSFGEALAEAQQLGYAEADPIYDVEGVDAAHKLTILASIAFGIPLRFDEVYCEGISRVTVADVGYAGELGYRIKHLGIARRREQGVELRVHPTLVPERRLLANVEGVMNAIMVYGDAVGPTVYYGPGAGAEATASAVVADLVDIVRALTADPGHRVPLLAFQPSAIADVPILAAEDMETAYYLRLLVMDKPGVLADITRILGEFCISIEAIIQKEPEPEATHVPVIITTRTVREGEMDQAIRRMQALPAVMNDVVRLRIEQFDG